MDDSINKHFKFYQQLEMPSSLNIHKVYLNRGNFSINRSFQLLFIIVIIVINLTLSRQIVSANNADNVTSNDEKNLNEKMNLSNEEEQLMSRVEPRQYFKIHTIISNKSNRNNEQNIARRIAKGVNNSRIKRNNSTTSLNLDSTPNEKSSLILNSPSSSQQQTEKQLLKNKQKSISNATLKKLLNQALLNKTTLNNNSSSSSSSSIKQPNFKFVFIQRATASPNSDKKLQSNSSSNYNEIINNNNNNNNVKESVNSLSENINFGNRSKSVQNSLAASVSKQLANSLMSSAVNIIGNLTSSSSLSTLASQIVANSLASSIDQNRVSSIANNSINNIDNDNSQQTTKDSSSLNNFDDIKRINNKVDNLQATTKGLTVNNNDKKSIKPKRPSKIYNLPVKFVSNGQPNMIVFNTIRQHFATIKKLQKATSKLHANAYAKYGNNSNNNNNNNNKFRRPLQKGFGPKGNSRLIYLPLKYLSNGKPNKIIIGKATHKSNN